MGGRLENVRDIGVNFLSLIVVVRSGAFPEKLHSWSSFVDLWCPKVLMRGPLAKELHSRSSLHRVTAGDVKTAEIEGSRLQGSRVLPLKSLSLLQKGT